MWDRDAASRADANAGRACTLPSSSSHASSSTTAHPLSHSRSFSKGTCSITSRHLVSPPLPSPVRTRLSEAMPLSSPDTGTPEGLSKSRLEAPVYEGAQYFLHFTDQRCIDGNPHLIDHEVITPPDSTTEERIYALFLQKKNPSQRRLRVEGGLLPPCYSPILDVDYKELPSDIKPRRNPCSENRYCD